MYPNLVGINTISLLRLAQRGDRAGGKIRGATLPTLARAYSHTVECTRYRTHTRTVTVHVRAITSSFPLLVSRFLDFAAVTDNRSLGLLQHFLALRMTLSSAHSAFLSPTLRPKAVAFFRFPQECVRAELRACPSDPFIVEVAGQVSSRVPLTGTRFVKPAQGLTLMLGLTPRHSCHPISHTGRGASARETSGRIACNRTCVCVRLATD